MTKNDEKVCDRCGHPAAFRDPRRKLDVCEVCAHADHGEHEGERWAAVQMFAAAAQTAVDLAVKGPELAAVLAEALEHESRHETLDLRAGLREEERASRRWLWRLDRLEEGEAA